jgi:hypothetical protein
MLAACEAPAEIPPDAVVWLDGSGSVDVELGGGITMWKPFEDGQPVDIITGIQGGYHIWVSARLAASEVPVARFYVETRFESDNTLVGPDATSQAPLELQTNGFRDRVGLRAFINDPSAVRGKRLRIHLELSCPDGRHGISERVVVPI